MTTVKFCAQRKLRAYELRAKSPLDVECPRCRATKDIYCVGMAPPNPGPGAQDPTAPKRTALAASGARGVLPDDSGLHDLAPPASRRGAIPLARGAELSLEMLAAIDVLAEALDVPLDEALARCLAHGSATMTDEEVRAAHRSLQAENDAGLFAAREEP